jgi:hypothetical protein
VTRHFSFQNHFSIVGGEVLTAVVVKVSLFWENEMGRACSTNGGEEECI